MSTTLTLVIGNKNYSSWSLRPWVLLRHFDVAFEEVRLPLDTPDFRDGVFRYSPSGRVPVLHDADLVVWDSLAICEYVNEKFLDDAGWPDDVRQRARARSAAAEMHSGFAALRSQLPMNVRRMPDAYRWNAEAQADIDRVQALWRELRRDGGRGGEFLCGAFGIVDAMFAPVVFRFRGYGVTLEPESQAYMDAMLELPSMREWEAAGTAESERLEKYESIKG